MFDLAAHRDDEDIVRVAEFDDVRGHAESGDERARATLDEEFHVVLQRFGKGGEQVHTEWLGGQFLRRGDLLRETFTRHGRGPEAAVTSRVRDRGDQFAVGDAAHSGEHDGVFDLAVVRSIAFS